MKANDVTSALKSISDKQKALTYQRFFKTGKGEYGEGDIFLGISVPDLRKIAKQYKDLSHKEIEVLLQSKIHDHRLVALLILVDQFNKGDQDIKKHVYDIYIKNSKKVNNWDLVDLSAGYIVGQYLFEKDRSILDTLATSNNLWERRISIIATFAFIRKDDFHTTLHIAEILLHDEHDLIHKAVGWMLREVGKRDLAVEEGFLKKYYKIMPRTMLRYAIEKFDEKQRQYYLKK
ncbi:DNA alkylation repair protein [Patescibacteria group bacterium]